MEDKVLNEKESLELISQMIRNTQQKLKDGNGKPFLIFGYVTVLIFILVYSLIKTTHNNLYNLAWLGIPLVGFLLLYFSKKKEDKYYKTYIDRIISNIWFVIVSAVFLISFLAFFIQIPVLSILILLLGIGTALTGLRIKFQPVIICGILGMFSCILPFLVNGYEQVLIFGLCIFTMMLIPGYILHSKSKNQHV